MAPSTALPKRKPRENQYLFDLGVRGRKTGLTLPDTGIRDENGLEPMDHLFSSPEKAKAKSVQKMNGAHKNANRTLTSEEDMDVDESTIPEPTAVLNERKHASVRLPPRSKSPIKTFLQSPARRHPSFGPGSSPIRPAPRASSVSTSVRRKLDFSNASFDSINEDTAKKAEGTPQKRAGTAVPILSTAKLANGTNLKPLGAAFSDRNDEEVNRDDSIADDGAFINGDDSMQLLNEDSQTEALADEADEDPEPEPVPEPEARASKKGKAKASEEIAEKLAKRGRLKKVVAPEVHEEEQEPKEEVVERERPKKRTRSSLNGGASDIAKPPKNKTGRPKKVVQEAEQVAEEVEERPAKSKGGRTKKAAEELVEAVEQEADEIEERPAKRTRRSLDGPAAPKATGRPKNAAVKPKATARKPKLTTITEDNSPAVQRGPPLPRTNNGLFILRRETPSEGAGFKQTRSGRNSIKPVAYWKNERIEYAEDEMDDAFGKFLLPRIKEVVRAEEVEQPKQKRSRAKSKAPKSRKDTAEPESEDDDEVEPWELEPGNVFGSIRAWDPEDPTGAEVEELVEEVALSSAAIIASTRDIAGASFKFAKTLSYPFFGAGMVDLPPGAQKKPKNSRRMQMAFFVFYGRVKVTVNDTEFRIGKGGMFQVPRGNFYSLENDYEKPARIFFAQGCELPDATNDSQ